MADDVVTCYVAPDVLLRLLIAPHARQKAVELLDAAQEGGVKLVTSDFALREALLCVEETDQFDVLMLRRIFEVMELQNDLIDFSKVPLLSQQRKLKLRSIALRPEVR